MQVVKAAAKSESGWLFAVPVTDDIAPGYSQEITKPMDLGTVAKNLKSGAYYTLGMPSLAICEILIVSCSHSLVMPVSCVWTGAWEACSCMGQSGVYISAG